MFFFSEKRTPGTWEVTSETLGFLEEAFSTSCLNLNSAWMWLLANWCLDLVACQLVTATVPGQNPAPPKKHWNVGSAANTNKQWLDFVHSQYFPGGDKKGSV